MFKILLIRSLSSAVAIPDLNNDELKNICQIEHTRHRSVAGFILNIMSAIAAYSFLPKKPSIKKDIEETNPELIAQLNQPKLLAA